jgi:murein DD-endopeptidase MepM/ murein hydrolase activator NlpD
MRDCVPYIPPVTLTKVRFSDGFRYRTDPVYGDIRFHSGIDFSGPTGMPVFATGNGVVKEVAYSFFGYGNCIIIDHGFGYATRYAHLRTASVHNGQAVKRGEQIGTLGSTGKSTGPHLHYEVYYLGKHQNPMNYFSSDITVEEYEKILANAHENKEFD